MQPVVVNETEIDAAAIAAEMQNHPAGSAEAAEAEARRALAVRVLLLDEADRLGIVAEPVSDDSGRRESDEEARIRQLLEREVTVPRADEAACRRYYGNNPAKFRSPDIFEPAHILLSADAEDKPAYAKALAKAKELIALLEERPNLFAALAREHSSCPTAGEGGRLGQVTRGQTTPAFESMLLALEPGQLAPAAVPTRYGVHVIRLDRKEPGRQLPFEAVKGRIAAYLEEASWRRAVAQYLSILAGRARIEGAPLTASPTPLVQ